MREGYKDSDLGEIPEDWEVVKLSEFTDEITDFVASGSFESLRNNVNVYSERNYALYIRLTDIRKGLGHTDQKYVDKLSYDFLSKSNLFGKEILFANIGANVGEVHLMPTLEYDSTIAPNMIVIRANNERIEPVFLYSYLDSVVGKKEINKIIAGSGHPKINKTDLRQLLAILPPLPEQQKIAKILSTVDEKIDVIDQQIAETTELKKGLMQRLLTKGIGHTKFKDSPLGEIPESWEVNRLGEVTKTFAGGTPRRSDSSYYNGDIPWVKSGEVNQRNIFCTSEFVTGKAIKETATRLIPKDCVLVALYGATAGNVGRLRIEACSNQAVLAINSINENLINAYVYHYLKLATNKLISFSQGSGQPNLSKGIIDSVYIPLPPLPEQQKIVNILSTVDNKLEVLKDKKAEFQELKKGLMQNLLTGKIRVLDTYQSKILIQNN
jgi:type I restriction enzyme S subunit